MFISGNKTGTLVMYNAETGAAQDTGCRALVQQYRDGHALGTTNMGDLRTAFIYLVISIALAVFGAVYEHFSFGVYSYFMIYAFAIPLAGGTLPFMLKYLRDLRGKQDTGAGHVTGVGADRISGEWLWHAGIATLTIGSIIHGILAICGRPNSLTVIYLISGIALLIVAAVSYVLAIKRNR